MCQLDLELCVPTNPLRPVQPGQEIRGFHDQGPFKFNLTDGSACWDYVWSKNDTKHPRVVICPDEGSPMFSAWQFLLSRDALAHLSRDELLLVFTIIAMSFLKTIVSCWRHKLQTHHLRCLQCTPGLKSASSCNTCY